MTGIGDVEDARFYLLHPFRINTCIKLEIQIDGDVIAPHLVPPFPIYLTVSFFNKCTVNTVNILAVVPTYK